MTSLEYFLTNGNGQTVGLPVMGQQQGDCKRLSLTSPFEFMRASFYQDESLGQSVQYFKGGKRKTYGTIST